MDALDSDTKRSCLDFRNAPVPPFVFSGVIQSLGDAMRTDGETWGLVGAIAASPYLELADTLLQTPPIYLSSELLTNSLNLGGAPFTVITFERKS